MTPRVSVVMAVRNGGPYLAEAVASVLGQSLGDLELVVVDDGSTDGTAATLDAIEDPRIVRLRNERPLGAAAARNRALEVARGEFVAIQDADDVAMRGRLEAQAAFLDAHPEYGVCAARFTTIDRAGVPLIGRPPVPSAEALVVWRLLLFSNPVCHSTLFARRSVVRAAGPYDTALAASHDRDFVGRLLRASRLFVLPEELVRFRLHPDSMGARSEALQRANSLHVRRNLLRWFHGPGVLVYMIDSWYAAPIPKDRVAPLTDLLLRTYAAVLERYRPAPHDADLVRADLAGRLESIRLRDGRIAREIAGRAFVSGLVRGTLSRLGLGRRKEQPGPAAEGDPTPVTRDDPGDVSAPIAPVAPDAG